MKLISGVLKLLVISMIAAFSYSCYYFMPRRIISFFHINENEITNIEIQRRIKDDPHYPEININNKDSFQVLVLNTYVMRRTTFTDTKQLSLYYIQIYTNNCTYILDEYYATVIAEERETVRYRFININFDTLIKNSQLP